MCLYGGWYENKTFRKAPDILLLASSPIIANGGREEQLIMVLSLAAGGLVVEGKGFIFLPFFGLIRGIPIATALS